MRTWWDGRPAAVQALVRMAGYVVYAIAAGLLIRFHAAWVWTVPFAIFTVVHRLNARDLTTRTGQRVLLAEAYETMRIPPKADRALWREWLQPREVSVLSRRWERVEALVGAGSLGVGAVIAFDVTGPALIAIIIASSMIAGVVFDAWTNRRPTSKPNPGHPSDRAYLLAQLDALDRPRDS